MVLGILERRFLLGIVYKEANYPALDKDKLFLNFIVSQLVHMCIRF